MSVEVCKHISNRSKIDQVQHSTLEQAEKGTQTQFRSKRLYVVHGNYVIVNRQKQHL